jgi:type IV secretory pathway component VirB8
MAENSESINELKTEIAGSRERLSRELQGLRYELDFPAKFRRSFRKQTGSWISAAAAAGALIALAPMRKKKVYVDARSRRKGDKKLMQTGLAMAALKLVGNLARPLVMEFVKNRFFYSGEPSRARK